MGTRKTKKNNENDRGSDTARAATADVRQEANTSFFQESLPEIPAREPHEEIAEAAYLRAERRGFNGGDPLLDWLEAEKEVLGRIDAKQ